jgi:hypothetical protein
MRYAFLLFLIGYLFVTPVHAEPSQSPPPFHGVWNGNIGKLPITACINADIESYRSASYYYHRHLSPIELRIEDGAITNTSTTWREANGIWQIDSASSDQINGTWTSADGTRKLPIKLTRVALSANDSADGITPCGSDAYNAAIVASLKTTHGPIVSAGKVKYRVITDALPSGEQSWQTIELVGNGPAIAAINQSIREHIGEQGKMGLACRSMAMNSSASEGVDYQEVGVTILGRWISVTKRSATDCRVLSREAFEETFLWDVTTGKQESLFSLIIGAEAPNKREYIPTEGNLPEALDKFIARRFGQGDPGAHLSMHDLESCYGPYQPGGYSYQLKLFSDGIIFEIPATRDSTCGVSFQFTFKELRPFLNKKGRQIATELQALQKSKQ